jgi:hypothetical protein
VPKVFDTGVVSWTYETSTGVPSSTSLRIGTCASARYCVAAAVAAAAVAAAAVAAAAVAAENKKRRHPIEWARL